MDPPAGVATVETLQAPERYSRAQLELACAMCAALRRGKLILCLPPER